MPLTHDPHLLRQAAIGLLMATANTPAGAEIVRRMLHAAVTPAGVPVARLQEVRDELYVAVQLAQRAVGHVERAEILMEGEIA